MSTIALKVSSLAIRTLSKPIGNLIKRQAREHEGFRRTCIAFAQALHRVDMRLRLGLLRDAAAIEKQQAREAADLAARKHKHPVITVKTEAQSLATEKATSGLLKDKEKPFIALKTNVKPRIRPLSEAKAIESGATFISEAFLFGVAGSLIIFEAWRSRRRENNRREDVADRLSDLEESESAARRALIELEKEVMELRAEHKKKSNNKKPERRILRREIWAHDEDQTQEEDTKPQGWLARISSYIYGEDAPVQAAAEKEVGPVQKVLAASDVALAAKHQKASEENASADTSNTTARKLG